VVCLKDEYYGTWVERVSVLTNGEFEVKDNRVIWIWEGEGRIKEDFRKKRNTIIILDAPVRAADRAHVSGLARFYDPTNSMLKDTVCRWRLSLTGRATQTRELQSLETLGRRSGLRPLTNPFERTLDAFLAVSGARFATKQWLINRLKTRGFHWAFRNSIRIMAYPRTTLANI
jgi:hypothetical protein